jgi:hypothetical protein
MDGDGDIHMDVEQHGPLEGKNGLTCFTNIITVQFQLSISSHQIQN